MKCFGKIVSVFIMIICLFATGCDLRNMQRAYTEEEKLAYKPNSLTVTLYDVENSIYGFTYNTENEPKKPVLQIQKGTVLTETCLEYEATVTKGNTYDKDDRLYTYYIVKAEVPLEPSCAYAFRAYDKVVGIGTEETVLQTKDVQSTSFSFAHISDSQTASSDNTGKGTGKYFADVLSCVAEKSDFLLHTGDIVEWSKYEGYWDAMINDNFAYLSKIPMMAISGNHETTYHNGKNEQFKHFHNKIPTQNWTDYGYYYSFVYGNTKFIMLNTNELSNRGLAEDQYDWLLDELKNKNCTWTIVAMHTPMYSVGKYGADPKRNQDSLLLRSQLKDVFAQYGVDIVLQGHDHAISRTYPIDADGTPTEETWQTENDIPYSIDPNGVIYVMNGPAGNQTREPVSVDDTLYRYAQGSHSCSWADFTIEGEKLTVSVKYTDGKKEYVYQEWGIKKTIIK